MFAAAFALSCSYKPTHPKNLSFRPTNGSGETSAFTGARTAKEAGCPIFGAFFAPMVGFREANRSRPSFYFLKPLCQYVIGTNTMGKLT